MRQKTVFKQRYRHLSTPNGTHVRLPSMDTFWQLQDARQQRKCNWNEQLHSLSQQDIAASSISHFLPRLVCTLGQTNVPPPTFSVSSPCMVLCITASRSTAYWAR